MSDSQHTAADTVRRSTLLLAVVLALVAGAGGGFLVARQFTTEPKPASAPLALEQQCDEANGIWMDLEEAHSSEFLDHLPNFARVPGCYRQIGGATAWILDLDYSGEQANQWADANGYTQQDLINGVP